MSPEGQDKLLAHMEWAEGFRSDPYLCPQGYLTIGFGRNLNAKGISKSEGRFLLYNDMQEALRDAQRLPVFQDLDEVRQMVLVDMVFNMGLSGVRGFRRMFSALSARDYERAADEMKDSRWFRQTGRRAERLISIMRTGVWIS